MRDPSGWVQSSSLDHFVDAIPEFYTAPIVAIEGLARHNNSREGSLGGSGPNGSYEKAVVWPKSTARPWDSCSISPAA